MNFKAGRTYDNLALQAHGQSGTLIETRLLEIAIDRHLTWTRIRGFETM